MAWYYVRRVLFYLRGVRFDLDHARRVRALTIIVSRDGLHGQVNYAHEEDELVVQAIYVVCQRYEVRYRYPVRRAVVSPNFVCAAYARQAIRLWTVLRCALFREGAASGFFAAARSIGSVNAFMVRKDAVRAVLYTAVGECVLIYIMYCVADGRSVPIDINSVIYASSQAARFVDQRGVQEKLNCVGDSMAIVYSCHFSDFAQTAFHYGWGRAVDASHSMGDD